MKHYIFFLSAFGLVMLFPAFTGSTVNSNDTIELVKRSGGTRLASSTEVLAFISSNDLVTIEMNNYSGTVSVRIEGEGGVLQQGSQVSESGFIMLDTSALPAGIYDLYITLDNGIYEGYFEK